MPPASPWREDGDKLKEFFGDHGTELTYVVVVDAVA